MPNEILVHPFKDKCPDIDEFFKSDNNVGIINTINALCYKIKLLADKYAATYDPDKFKGDALELFVEYLIKTNASDNRIGIYNYKPISEDDQEDFGVDGSGIGDNQNPATVQVKFRSGDYVLTANNDHLSNFLTASWVDFNVPVEDNKNMLIVTTGLKVDEQSREKMLKNKVRVLNRDALRQMLDNRPEWWLNFYDSVKASRTQRQIVPTIKLREFQEEAATMIMKDANKKGMIILPTGTGKTVIEAEVIRRTIEECHLRGIVPVIKVNSSRILLCFQLFEEVFKYISSHGIEAKYFNYNSGNADDKYYAIQLRKLGGCFREIVSTTSVEEIKKVYAKMQKEKIPLIVFSTYHSSEKFSTSGIVPDLTIHDEAHNLVSPEFCNVAILPSDADYFFTATMKTTDSDKDKGMNNKDIFDNIIYSKSAKTMVEKGEMVAPWIHVVRGRSSKGIDVEKVDADYGAIFNSITSSFFAHEKKIKELAYDVNEIGAKVLVVCRGQQDLMEMYKTKEWKNFRVTNPDIHLYALSSEFGLLNDDDHSLPPVTNSKKFRMIKSVKELGNNARCIIFHVDMIGEGIDVSGITGVMPFRNCELSKFVQNVGRAARLHKLDRQRLYSGELNVGDTSKYIKPYSWIIIPEFLSGSEGFADRFRCIIEKLRNEYGFIPKQNTIIDNAVGLSDDENIDVDNWINKKKKHTNSGVDTFDHEFESMSAIERIIFDDEVEIKMEKIREELKSLIGITGSQLTPEDVKDFIQSSKSPMFIMRRVDGEGKMMIIDGKCTILKGSKIRSEVVKSFPSCFMDIREDWFNDGAIVDGVFVRDIVCESPSMAACILGGGSINGKTAWKTREGLTYGDYLKNQLTNSSK